MFGLAIGNGLILFVIAEVHLIGLLNMMTKRVGEEEKS